MNTEISSIINQAHLPSKISLLVFALFVSLSSAFSKQRPNIVFILVDDMGFSDIGCYGGEVNTPHLDRLAENGLRFTNMYNTFQVLPIPSLLAHWGLCTTMWHEPQFKRNQECDNHGRSSKNRGISYLGSGQTSFQ
jgi:hypothetical protein